MKKIFQNPVVAWIFLILAVVLAVVLGQVRKSAPLPNVAYGSWICDDAKMLSSATEGTLADYNRDWNQKYGAVIAVATVDRIKGWEPDKYADSLGQKWGLGEKDMLLLIYPKKNGVDYWVSMGSYLQENSQDSQVYAMKNAIESDIYSAGAEAGATALFRQADVYYAQVLGRPAWNQTVPDTTQWKDRSGVSIFKVILLIIAILVVWAILDRIRYGRYRRRSVVNVGVPAVSYYPIFWGRPSRAAVPHAPVPPHHPGPVYHSPSQPPRPSGSYSAQPTHGHRRNPVLDNKRPSSPTRPGNTAKPGNTSKPSGFGKGGFGGGKR